jgi:hypothetical protein
MRRALLCAFAGALLLGALAPRDSVVSARAIPTGPLKFFKNFFVTGDYVVGGVGLQGQGSGGVATGPITISGVPAGADVTAAYLYWQVVLRADEGPDAGSNGAMFNGISLTSDAGPLANALGEFGSAPCWSQGGGTGQSGGEKRTYTFRADVLRYLPTNLEGKTEANGTHTVKVPDSGSTGNVLPLAVGASLVVVYQDPSKPYNAVVIYDGSFTIDNANPTLTQQIEGHYDPAATPDASVTFIAGSGQANKNEIVTFNSSQLGNNPFASTAGAAWDNPTFPVNPGAGPQVTASVTTANVSSSDCLNFGAIIFKTAVNDSDGDGLLDVWEAATAASPVLDPTGQALPALADMGALVNAPDIFLEIGYFKTDVALTYGGELKPAHSHLPDHEALKLLGDAFDRKGIKLHIDVGDTYPTGDPVNPAKNADAYIIRGTGLATGGEAIDEGVSTQCVNTTGAPYECQFTDYPGTVGWKTGFRYLRDEVLSGPAPVPGQPDPCDDLNNSSCLRRFDRNRKDIFHYALFAHHLAIPQSESPCLDGLGQPTGTDTNGLCGVQVNPLFRKPRTTTGVGDFPGGDILVTLGAFPDAAGLPTGTPFMIASTAMHEMGHNFGRRHSGEASTTASPNPNCKPTYLSVMNYLYQLRGLLDNLGKPHLDFSEQAGPTLNEQVLQDGVDMATWQSTGPYRLGWYAPLAGSYLQGQAQPVARHCDGSELLPTDVPMVRIDAPTAQAPIDWNANGILEIGTYGLDINFNGRTTATMGGSTPELLFGSNDWANLRLNQVGGRRAAGGPYIDSLGNFKLGPLSLDAGRADYGRGDYGRADYGRADYGRADYGRGDLGRGDYGRGDYGRADYGRADYGRGDYGRGDYGGGDHFRGDPNNIGGELDAETAGHLAKTPPNEFTACIVGVNGCTAPQGTTAGLHDVLMTFKHPNVGGVQSFKIVFVQGTSLQPGQTWNVVEEIPAVPGQTEYVHVENGTFPNGTQFIAFAQAVFADVTSDPSNQILLTAVDDSPTISEIADQTISMNSNTGPIAFTITDEDVAAGTLTGTSSNTTLVPNANIVFGGTGASRTVTVTPVPGQIGSTTITVTFTDAAGNPDSETFVLTVGPSAYVFSGFFSPLVTAGTISAPSNSGLFNHGKAIPIKWSLTLGGVIVSNLNSLSGLRAVPGTWTGTFCSPNGGTTLFLLDPVTGRPTGNSQYRFSSNQFVFNWDTSATVRTSCYTVSLTLDDGTAARATTIRFR